MFPWLSAMHLRALIIQQGAFGPLMCPPLDPSGLHGASDGRPHCCRAGSEVSSPAGDVLIKRALHLSLILTPQLDIKRESE
ncbi:hypothetical protein KUCAC02_017056 [Chaenocephalus aceratus]|nr:hypothetical protein KUCAC02_017056 [Chaenocephalus aceratus]